MRANLFSIVTAASVFAMTGCAHQSLAVATTAAEATSAPKRDGLGLWIKRDGPGVEIAAACSAGGDREELKTHIDGEAGAAVMGFAGALRLLAPVARMYEFDEARGPDGVLTMARELGPLVLSVHAGRDLLAVQYTEAPQQ